MKVFNRLTWGTKITDLLIRNGLRLNDEPGDWLYPKVLVFRGLETVRAAVM